MAVAQVCRLLSLYLKCNTLLNSLQSLQERKLVLNFKKLKKQGLYLLGLKDLSVKKGLFYGIPLKLFFAC